MRRVESGIDMKGILQNGWVELVLRYIVGMTFVYASIHKIEAPAEFAKVIYGYGLFPPGIINLVAVFVPFLEVITGLAIILGIYPRAATVLVGVMLLLFIIAISINLIRGYEFDCGCFSFTPGEHKSSSVQLLVRDVVYFILCVLVLGYHGDRRWAFMNERKG